MAGRFCGHYDPELNERGRQQLAGLVNRLSQHPVRRVYTSDLRRARQTAEAIANHFGAGLHVRPELREIDFGLWEGLSWNEIEVRDAMAAKNWAENYPNSTAPAGESFEQFQQRVRREIAFLLGEVKEAAVAVVTHAGFTRAVLTSLCGVSEREAWNRTEDYGSVVALDTNDIDRVEVKDSDSRDPGVWPRPRGL
jgi:broad specificity phosphatase PhoE